MNERSVAWCKMFAVSDISTINVDCPEARSSEAPTRVKMRSQTPTRALSAGTNEPTWAMSVMSAAWRITVDFPDMFGLVVRGAAAQYKGAGLVNGMGDYGFLLTATDGQLAGGDGWDKFRLKIWTRDTGQVVYDNRLGISDAPDNADPQQLGGGSIVIHKPK